MGDFRITIDAVGGHGCGRTTVAPIYRCGLAACPDCMAIEFVQALQRKGASVGKATLEHWPKTRLGAPDRNDSEVGPTDDLIAGTRNKKF